MSILIKDVYFDGKSTNIYINDNNIAEISEKAGNKADKVIDARGKAVLPGLVNMHTHAAMSLLRGYADDLPLNQWLEEKIWPTEAKLKPKHIESGTAFACLEMIKSGTTCFLDMYWHPEANAKATSKSGLRSVLNAVIIGTNKSVEDCRRETKKNLSALREYECETLKPSLGPHAIYTVTKEQLEWINSFSEEQNLLVHMHLSETDQEVKDCVKDHGSRPAEYLQNIGFLSDNKVFAHCVHLNKKEAGLLGKSGCKAVHCPTSNMKLAVGGTFPYSMLRSKEITCSLGTDGCSSNNNLDMFEEMKFASLLQKFSSNNPTVLPAREAIQMATSAGAESLGFNAGRVEEGKLADLILVDLKELSKIPLHSLDSNIVYSANGSVVTHSIVNGELLMEDRKVEGEEKTIEKFNKAVEDIFQT